MELEITKARTTSRGGVGMIDVDGGTVVCICMLGKTASLKNMSRGVDFMGLRLKTKIVFLCRSVT